MWRNLVAIGVGGLIWAAVARGASGGPSVWLVVLDLGLGVMTWSP